MRNVLHAYITVDGGDESIWIDLVATEVGCFWRVGYGRHLFDDNVDAYTPEQLVPALALSIGKLEKVRGLTESWGNGLARLCECQIGGITKSACLDECLAWFVLCCQAL